MSDEEPHVVGQWPDLSGKVLEQVLCQEFWYDGKLEEPANAIGLLAGGQWYRLMINQSTVFLRQGEGLSANPTQPDALIQYKTVDLGADQGLAGGTISTFDKRALGEGAQVEIAFADGRRLIFTNKDEVTSYEVVPG